MTLGHFGLLLPMLELAAAVRLVLLVHYKRYPMLLAFLVLEAAGQIAALTACRWWIVAWISGQPLRMSVRALVVAEVFQIGCIRMTPAQRWRAAVWVVSFSIVGGAAFGCAGLSPLQSFVLFRQFFHLLLATALVALSLYIWRHPVMENRDHMAYRIGMTAIMLSLAIASTFVRNGFGYVVFPYSMRTWVIVDRVQWISMMLIVAGLTWGMTSSISSFRPAVADRIRARRARRLRIGDPERYASTWGKP